MRFGLFIFLQAVSAFQLHPLLRPQSSHGLTPASTARRRVHQVRFSSLFDEEATRAFKQALLQGGSGAAGGVKKAVNLLLADLDGTKVQVTKVEADTLLTQVPVLSATSRSVEWKEGGGVKPGQICIQTLTFLFCLSHSSGSGGNGGASSGGELPAPLSFAQQRQDQQKEQQTQQAAVLDLYLALKCRGLLQGFGGVVLPGGEPYSGVAASSSSSSSSLSSSSSSSSLLVLHSR